MSTSSTPEPAPEPAAEAAPEAASEQARARARERHRLRRRNLRITFLVLLGLVIVGGAYYYSTGGDRQTAQQSLAPATVRDGVLVVGARPDAAPVQVTVYEDFLCPYCRELEESSRGFLRRAARQGTVAITYRPFQILDDNYSAKALAAYASVLQTGTPREAEAFHDKLYDEQPYENDSTKPGVPAMRGWARDIGITDQTVLQSIGDAQTAAHAAAQKAAADAGVDQTPWVLIDGRHAPGSTVSEIVASLRQAVRGAGSG